MKKSFFAVIVSVALLIAGVGANPANANGSLDSSFGTGGKVTTAIGASSDFAYSVAIQSDGKIVAAGYSYNGSNNDFALARYNANGSLDSSFGTGGKVTTVIGASSEEKATSIAIQSDGKIVAAGYSDNGGNYDFALVRYNTDGSLDSSFGTGGKVTTAIGASSEEEATSIAIQSDGKIVAAGYSDNGGNYDFALARYNTDGSLDSSFGTGGKVTTAIGASSDFARSIAIQSDGKIVASGTSNNGSNYDFALARYNANGSLDSSFGTGGKVTTVIGASSEEEATSIAIQSDGKIVAAGYSDNGGNYDFALVRYNTDGSLDSSFGTGGKVTTAIGASSDFALSIATQSDGKIVAAGYSLNGSNYDFALARYNTDGSLDSSFGTGGKVTTAIGASSEEATSIAIQSDGKIVAAGYSDNGGNYDFAVVRYINSPALVVDDTVAQAKAAAAQREAEKRNARAEILAKYKKSESISIELFAQAEIAGITKENIVEVQAEIAALLEISRADITQVLKIARKYEVVGMVASDRVDAVYSKSLIEIGLIPADSKHKAALTEAIKNLPVDERSSYAAIKVALDAKMAEIQARKDRLTAILALIASRRAG